MSRTRYNWDELIPVEETRTAVRYLVETWIRASRADSHKFKYSQNEPKLTERLSIYLWRHQADSGLTGLWSNESQEPMEDEDGNLIRIRKDISYFSNRFASRLDLTFEFKKLSKSNRSKYQGKNGIKRFVTGNYAKGQPLALMVAIVRQGDTEAIEGLYRSLKMPANQRALQMVQDSKGRYIFRPSQVVPHIVDFDTEHNRPPGKAPKNGTITLGHIFLYSPI